jgi:hypothetical protein
MGRRRALAALLIAAASLGANAPGELPLREARWIAPEARFEQLSTYPWPCFDNWTENLLYGAIAFRDPLLLGGQAARSGLNCGSCHRGGRGNSAFTFPGVSGMPGTADITASLFSSHRGDGVFNPVRIPDLTNDAPKVSRTAPGALEAFIRGLIVEEFDGAEPSPRIVSGLAEAIRALDSQQCSAKPVPALEADLASFVWAVAATETALDVEDGETAIAMLRGARSALGLIAERYPSALAASLDGPDAELARMQQALRDGESIVQVRTSLAAFGKSSDIWTKPLYRARSRSLYNPKRLKAALSAARTP